MVRRAGQGRPVVWWGGRSVRLGKGKQNQQLTGVVLLSTLFSFRSRPARTFVQRTSGCVLWGGGHGWDGVKGQDALPGPRC